MAHFHNLSTKKSRFIYDVFFLVFTILLCSFTSSALPENNDNPEKPCITCISEVQISIGSMDPVTLVPKMFLTVPSNPDPSKYMIDIVDPPVGGNQIDCSYEGKTIMVSIMNINTQEVCMSTAEIKDKMPPKINCTTMDVACTIDYRHPSNYIDTLLPNLEDNCTPTQDLEVYGIHTNTIMQPCSSPYLKTVEITWYATDLNGMQSSCIQDLNILRYSADDIAFPSDTTYQCGQVPRRNDLPVPTINGEPINAECCGFVSNIVYDTTNKGCGMMEIFVDYTYIDACNTMASAQQVISIQDTTPPVINCPDDLSIGTDQGLCTASYTPPNIFVSDDCLTKKDIEYLYYVNGNYNPTLPIQLEEGENTIRIVVRSKCNSTLQSECIYIVTVEDRETPYFEDCSPFIISLRNNSDTVQIDIKDIESIKVRDNCDDDLDLTIQRMTAGCGLDGTEPLSSILTVCCDDIGKVIEVMIRVTDDAGNVNMCSTSIEVIDKLAPRITCPPNVTINCNDVPKKEDYAAKFGTPTVTDNCGYTLTIENSNPVIDDCGEGNITRLFIATDESGNKSECTQIITIENRETFDASSIVYPSNYVTEDCMPNLAPSTTGEVTFTQPSCINLEVLYMDSVVNDTENAACKTINRMFMITNKCTGQQYRGNQTITVKNNGAPALTVPANQTVNASATNCFVNISLSNAMVTDCSPGATITNNLTSGGAIVKYNFPIGTTNVIYTAHDVCGHESKDTTVITVMDNTAPTITCPADVTMNNDPSECSSFVTIATPTVDDNCEENDLVITNDFTTTENASGEYPVGTTVVTYTVKDKSGNSTTCQLSVTVQDMEGPTIVTCPEDRTISVDTNCDFVVPDLTGELTYDDNCEMMSSMVTVSQDPNAGSVASGETVVTFTVEDSNGNSSQCSATLTPNDDIDPTFTSIQDDVVKYVGSDCKHILENYTSSVTATDNCGDVEITQTPPAGTEYINSAGQVVDVTLIATDNSGNRDTTSFKVTIRDTIAPTITCPADVTFYSTTTSCAVNANVDDPTVGDNCSGIVTFSNDYTTTPNASASYNLGTTAVTYTATDQAGNTAECTFNITVLDTIKPQFDNCPDSIVLATNSTCEAIVPDFSGDGYSDNCSSRTNITHTQSIPANTVIDASTTITLTIEDESGNTKMCEIPIILNDTMPPVLTTETSDTTILVDENCQYLLGDFTGSVVTATDNCALDTIIQSPGEGNMYNPGDVDDITFIAYDKKGNSDTINVTIRVIDGTAPSITCPATMRIQCDIDTDSLEQFGVFEARDACGIDTIYETYRISDNLCSTDTLFRTGIAVDIHGNRDTCVQLLIYNTNISPLNEDDFSKDTLHYTSCQDYLRAVEANKISDKCNEYSMKVKSTTKSSDPGKYCKIYNRTWTVTDSCTSGSGGSDYATFDITQVITVVDNRKPTLNIPNDITIVMQGDSCQFRINLGTADAYDCSGVTSIVNNSSYADSPNDDADGVYPVGIHFIDYSVTDSCGNNTTLTQMVKLLPDPEAIDYYCQDVKEHLIEDDGMHRPVAKQKIKFRSIPCGTKEDDYHISYSNTDASDSIRIVNCDSLVDNQYFFSVNVYIWTLGCVIDSCHVEYTVKDDNRNICPDGAMEIRGDVTHWKGQPIKNVTLELMETGNRATSQVGGTYTIENVASRKAYTIDGSLEDNLLNGVTAYDLYLIQRHILQIEEIHNPMQLLAADVDMSGYISGKDLTMLKRLILGIDKDYKEERSWIFVPDYMNDIHLIFPSNHNSNSYDRFYYGLNNFNKSMSDISFIGTKRGDVNGTVEISRLENTQGEIRSVATINVIDKEDELHFQFEEEQEGGAFQLEFEVLGGQPLHVESELPGFDMSSYFIDGNTVKIIYVSTQDRIFEKGEVLFSVKVEKRRNQIAEVELNKALLLPEIYFGNQVTSLSVRQLSDEGEGYALFGNRPNPFNNSTIISYRVPKNEAVLFTIFNASGQVITRKSLQALPGMNEIIIEPTELHLSGMYYYQIQCDHFTAMRKMVKVE